jgi:hypothetical protein
MTEAAIARFIGSERSDPISFQLNIGTGSKTRKNPILRNEPKSKKVA